LINRISEDVFAFNGQILTSNNTLLTVTDSGNESAA